MQRPQGRNNQRTSPLCKRNRAPRRRPNFPPEGEPRTRRAEKIKEHPLLKAKSRAAQASQLRRRAKPRARRGRNNQKNIPRRRNNPHRAPHSNQQKREQILRPVPKIFHTSKQFITSLPNLWQTCSKAYPRELTSLSAVLRASCIPTGIPFRTQAPPAWKALQTCAFSERVGNPEGTFATGR